MEVTEDGVKAVGYLVGGITALFLAREVNNCIEKIIPNKTESIDDKVLRLMVINEKIRLLEQSSQE